MSRARVATTFVAVPVVVVAKKDGLAMSVAKGAGVVGVGVLAAPFLIALVVVVALFVFGVAIAILNAVVPWVGNILFGFLAK